mgnify:CR=1 FL=1
MQSQECRQRSPSRRCTLEAFAPRLTSLGAMATPAIDQVQLSRQLYVMGMEAQSRMAQSDVLVVGMGGVGVEIGECVLCNALDDKAAA